MVKDEISWFQSLPAELTAGGKPIDMSLVHEVRDILLSAQNDKVLDVLNGYSAGEIASVVGNRWLNSGAVDLISNLINKVSSNVTVLNASNIKLSSMDDKVDKFLTKMKVGKETEMLIIVCNVGMAGGRNSIQFDNKGYHWALVVIDVKKFEIIYCDSLCMDSPANLESTVAPLLKFLKCNESKFKYHTAHSCNGLGCKKRCSIACSKYPIQTDGSSCGVIVAIVAAVLACCSDEERVSLLAPRKDRSLVEYPQKICKSLIDPCNFITELRCVLLSWIAQGKIDIDLVRESCVDESYGLRQKSNATLIDEETEDIMPIKNETPVAVQSATREENALEEPTEKAGIDISLERIGSDLDHVDYFDETLHPFEPQRKIELINEEMEDVMPPTGNSAAQTATRKETKAIQRPIAEKERLGFKSKGELAKILIKKRRVEKENGELSFGKNKKYLRSLVPCCDREWYLNMRKEFDDDESSHEKQSLVIAPTSTLSKLGKEDEFG